MIKHIIFDYDGVIADSLDLVIFRWNESSKLFGSNANVTKDSVKKLNTANWREFDKIHLGIPAEKQDEASKLFKSIGLSQPAAPPFPEMEVVIKQLSTTYELYVVSANYATIIERDLKSHGLLNYFKFIGGGELVGKICKPDPKFILTFLESWKLLPQDCLYVGDTAQEVECGKAAGVMSIAACWGYQAKELLQASKPDFIAETPNQLLEIINKLNV